MENRRTQVWVGSFVLAAAGILIAVVLAVSGALSTKGPSYRAHFKFAAGLAPAAPVRYGGLLAGKVDRLRVDPSEPSRIEITFRVRQDIPVKTDSIAKITSLGALGESYVEISPGSKDAPPAPPGSAIQSYEMLAISELGDRIGGLIPIAEQTLKSLNDRLSEMKLTITQVNDLLGERNRENISGSLANLNAMLGENRPRIAATLVNVQTATDRLAPLLKTAQTAVDRLAPLADDFKGTTKQANEALAHIDAILVENRPDIRATMIELRKTLNTANQVAESLRGTMERNSDNLDETMINVRVATDNLKQMTDTIKRRPSVLIRGETGKDRQPGSTR